MKFEYEDKQNGRKCIAFIDENGNLAFYARDGKVCFCVDGGIHNAPYTEHTDSGTKHKFYPGDKVTITF